MSEQKRTIPRASFSIENFGDFSIAIRKYKGAVEFKCGKTCGTPMSAGDIFNKYSRNEKMYKDEYDIVIYKGNLYNIKSFYIKSRGHYTMYGEKSDSDYIIDIENNIIADDSNGAQYDFSKFIIRNVEIAKRILLASKNLSMTASVMNETVNINNIASDLEYVKNLIREAVGNNDADLEFDGTSFKFGVAKLSIYYVQNIIKNDHDKNMATRCATGNPCTEILCSHPLTPETRDPEYVIPSPETNEIQDPEPAKISEITKSPNVFCVQKCEGFELITHNDGTYTIDIPNFSDTGDIGIIRSVDFDGQISVVVRGEKINIKFVDILYGCQYTSEVYMINYGKPLFLVTTCKKEERFTTIDRIINP